MYIFLYQVQFLWAKKNEAAEEKPWNKREKKIGTMNQQEGGEEDEGGELGELTASGLDQKLY